MPRRDLATYRQKRDFTATPEPAGGPSAGAGTARFVIQEHSARRLHWDLRLERDGVLASFALPNGVPDDPAKNRKAVATEDHPLEYLDFHGEIPKGSYGAGTMRIYDRGTYECHSWSDGKIVVTLHGEQVRGRYALFRTGAERDWMIHRVDPPADPDREPLPEHLVPMLARLARLPANERDYAVEVKWDGVRALAYSEPGRVRFESRNLRDVTASYPELRALNRALGAHTALLDGEIVALDERGRPSFERLQGRMHVASPAEARRRAERVPVTYVVFDLLHLDGRSLLERPYVERRAALEELALEGPAWRTPAYHAGQGRALLEATREQGLEGVVLKRLDSPYEPGRRTGAWLKVKNARRQELVVGGWLPGSGGLRGQLGALLVGYHEGPGGPLRYAGKVGTGFDAATRTQLLRLLQPLRRETSPFAGRVPDRAAVFAEPELVVEVDFAEWTAQGMLRHPSYEGLRDDRDPSTVVREEELDPDAPAPQRRPLAFSLAGERTRNGRLAVEVQGRRLELSNLDKVLYPRSGFTKGQLVEYYRRVAPALLPHLEGRPLTLKRYPDGVEGPHFYEKQCPGHRPAWVETAAIWSRHKNGPIEFCLATDLPTLLWAANLANVELHTSLSRADEIERPTMLVFDLDPGAPADLLDCAEIGLALRRTLAGVGLESWAKTSGSKGLQVYVPLNRDVTYEQTKPFARTVAQVLEKGLPDRVVSRMTKTLRPGKVLIDWSQNDEHKTTVCAYSLRARERPTVSAPVTWEELEAALDAGDAERLVFDAPGMLERVEELGDLFAPVLSLVQELPGG